MEVGRPGGGEGVRSETRGGENSSALGSIRARDYPTSFRKLRLDFKKTTSDLGLRPFAIPCPIIFLDAKESVLDPLIPSHLLVKHPATYSTGSPRCQHQRNPS
jgi:hypothetical protein